MSKSDAMRRSTRRRRGQLAVLAVVCLTNTAPAQESQPKPAAPADVLTVLSWGGAYEESQRAAFFVPFERETGTKVHIVQYDGGVEELRDQVNSGRPDWDVVDLVASDALSACDAGLLESLPTDIAAPPQDGTPVHKDFDPGSLTRCAIAQLVFSTVIAFDVRAFPGEKPQTVADFFDIARFPGNRALRCAPAGLLEWALLAYDVPPAQIYDLLSTERGLSLAFRKLDEIRPQLVWWQSGATPARLLREGKVAMSSGYNGRLFHAQVVRGDPIAVIWDGQLLEHATWAIPRGSANRTLAEQFIRFATLPERMADLASRISYAPTRASARRRIGLHATTGADMSHHLPTSGSRLARAIAEDSEWYARTAQLRQRRFREWLGDDACDAR